MRGRISGRITEPVCLPVDGKHWQTNGGKKMGSELIEGVHSAGEWIKCELDTSRIVRKKMVGNTAYIAYRDGSKVAGIVIVFHWRKEGIEGKIMGENMGPYYYECPKEILELLTPTTHPWALKWRAKNWENYGVKMDWMSMLSEEDRQRELFEQEELQMRSNGDKDLIVSAISMDVVPITCVRTADGESHFVTDESYKHLREIAGPKTNTHLCMHLCTEVNMEEYIRTHSNRPDQPGQVTQ
jgi:hypothetical protein